MPANEKQMYMGMLPGFANISPAHPSSHCQGEGILPYDPELLYVECQTCGKPVLWEQGKTTELLLAAGVDVSRLDERCMFLSEGCPSCSPSSRDGYTLAVVRIAGLTPEEAVYRSRPGGTA